MTLLLVYGVVLTIQETVEERPVEDQQVHRHGNQDDALNPLPQDVLAACLKVNAKACERGSHLVPAGGVHMLLQSRLGERDLAAAIIYAGEYVAVLGHEVLDAGKAVRVQLDFPRQ
jgi:hypothetical protein